MGSSRGQDQCLGTGLSLPQWMKGRADARYDIDHGSFSPPSHDDSFFCIRYSTQSSTDKSCINTAGNSSQEGYRPISQVLNDKNSNVNSIQASVSLQSAGFDVSKNKDVKNIDFSKHPLPCQPFVPVADGQDIKSSRIGSFNKVKVAKSQGTDDGFHSEPALCGKSIVSVANRMMSRKLAKIDSINESSETSAKSPTMLQHRNEGQFVRRGSKSLPVTPITSPTSTPDTSPKSRRRFNTNKYFNGTFGNERDSKYQTGWLLSSILGQSRELSMNAGNKIQEVDEEEPPALDLLPSKFLDRKKSISSQNLSYLGKSEEQQRQIRDEQSKKEAAIYTSVFKAKPSEIREMNFWSPTSM